MKKFNSEQSFSKRSYLSPKFEILYIHLEHPVAATSAKINPGSNGAPFYPEVEEWDTGWDYERTFDL